MLRTTARRIGQAAVVSRHSAPFSTTATAKTAAAPKTGAGLGQRLTSFLIGAGLMGVATQVTIYEELKSGNVQLIAKQQDIERRLAALEQSK